MNPYRLETPFVVSFSGGSTSGFMLRKILDAFDGKLPEDGEVIFNNTGLEHEKTLDFVREVEERWCPVTWLEFQPETRFKVVDYETASREGEPFTAMIDWRGYLPTPVARICTVNLKIRCAAAYLLNKGVEEWNNAMGLRYDEPHRVHRMKGDRKAETTVCPMYEAKHTLKDVDEFWEGQPFQLGIPRWMGNCCGCFLKSRGRIEKVFLSGGRKPKSAWVCLSELIAHLTAESCSKSAFRGGCLRTMEALSLATAQTKVYRSESPRTNVRLRPKWL